ncbi:restriction endonuclease subunit S [Citricoccus sp. NR2]|uniref:restriction endonuclease subunit S n=1 Tax=Citricoccus sp. NR2 TaxID=3004095 RepID=UPI0022DD3E68|nr:restriction endonuclease subunit S [Citricoccus sp. NR2]WBL18297.1 restriction endonuclease subunit S [Citricoccus sp. NR2]
MSLNLDKSNWKRVSFGDVVRNVNETVRDLELAGIDRIIAMEHMDPGELKVSRWSSTEDGTTFTRRVKPGQTLFGKRRAYQRKVAYAEFDAICSGDIYTFEADETQLRGDLLPFLVQSNGFFEHALGTSAGSLSPRTNWRDLKDFEFDLPALDEQKRIADLLWATETQKRKLDKQRAATVALAQLVRDQRFEARPWSATLGETITGITAGRSLAAGTAPAASDTCGVLKVSAVGAEGFVGSENKELLDQASFMPHFAVRAGDLLITRANTSAYVGRPAIVDADYPNLMLSDKTLRLEVDPALASAGFLREFLLTRRTRAAINAMATGTGAAMKNISQSQIRSLSIPRFSVAEQAELLNELELVRDGVTATDAEAIALESVRASLLDEIFRGN